MSESSTRKRVTAQDIPKLQLKVAPRIQPLRTPPQLPLWYFAPAAVPLALAYFIPSLLGLWTAAAVTCIWLGSWGLLRRVRREKHNWINHELWLYLATALAGGVALGSWFILFVRAIPG
jgi:hypothetical protein